MTALNRTIKWLLFLGFCTFFTVIAIYCFYLIPESSPAARGAMVDGVYGCLVCHGESNSKSLNGERISCEISHRVKSKHVLSKHPVYEGVCEDLLAFFTVVHIGNSLEERLRVAPDNRLLVGEQLARRYYCFQCHGELGQGGFLNLGSLKGYVPGYFGRDFKSLTNNASPEAVKAWILEGTGQHIIDRPIQGRIAKYYFEKQSIQMPEFNSLSNYELELLVEYVLALNELGPMDMTALHKYDAMTRQ